MNAVANQARNQLPFRDQLAIFAHEVRCVLLTACDMRDRPQAVSDEQILRLTQSIRRIDALRGVR